MSEMMQCLDDVRLAFNAMAAVDALAAHISTSGPCRSRRRIVRPDGRMRARLGTIWFAK
jgi:hypothetical protein